MRGSCPSQWEGFHKLICSQLLILKPCANSPQTLYFHRKQRGPKGEISGNTVSCWGSYWDQRVLQHFLNALRLARQRVTLLINFASLGRGNANKNNNDNDVSLSCPIMSQGISLTFGKPSNRRDKLKKLDQNFCDSMIWKYLLRSKHLLPAV